MKTITKNRLNSLYRFFQECENFVFLDTSKPEEKNCRSFLFVEPQKRLQFYQGQDENVFLAEIEKYQAQGYAIAGWFSYEFGYLLEPILKTHLRNGGTHHPLLADLGVFNSYYLHDHITGKSDFPVGNDLYQPGEYRLDHLRPSISEEEYLQALAKVLAYIEAGDTYQVNYTLKLFFDFFGSPERFYDDLRRNQSVGYGAYIRWQDQRILSFSPELFFWKKNGEIGVRPMKGTMKRGKNLEEDLDHQQFLRSDVKNQSENVMIVDLLRNDLGHLMHQLPRGDVRVDSLFDVEIYETLLQMTSTITGKSDPESLRKVPLHTLFEAIFPCGSVTGAPKIRTMEIIAELENENRGVYTGAIGCMLPDGETIFNVPIRTVVLDGTRGEMGIGSGIVHDSEPQQEWQECLLKGRFLTKPQESFQLIETLLYHPDHGFYLLDKHLLRLAASAQYFLFQFSRPELMDALERRVAEFNAECRRIRILLDKDGSFSISSNPCEAPAHLVLPTPADKIEAELPKVRWSEHFTDSDSRWFFHKTTRRSLYDREFQLVREKNLFDMLFCNESSMVTEGCITNIIICKDGEYLTPPVSEGLLPGIMRQHLLEEGGVPIIEKPLTKADVEGADGIFLCNSVRGVVQVALEP